MGVSSRPQMLKWCSAILGDPEYIETAPVAGFGELAHLGDDGAVVAFAREIMRNVEQSESHQLR